MPHYVTCIVPPLPSCITAAQSSGTGGACGEAAARRVPLPEAATGSAQRGHVPADPVCLASKASLTAGKTLILCI